MQSIAIVIPCRNSASTLAETLASVASQSEPPDEVIVSDNFSTDETRMVIERSGMKNIRMVQPEHPLGMTAHWNFAVRQSSAEWVTLLHADDILEPGWVEALRLELRARTDADFFFCRCPSYLDVFSARSLLETQDASFPSGEDKETILSWFSNGFAVRNPGTAWCRRLFDQVGGFDEELPVCSDLEYILKCLALGHPLACGKSLAGYRRFSSAGRSLTSTVNANGALIGDILTLRSRLLGNWPSGVSKSVRDRLHESLGRCYLYPALPSLLTRNRGVIEKMKVAFPAEFGWSPFVRSSSSSMLKLKLILAWVIYNFRLLKSI